MTKIKTDVTHRTIYGPRKRVQIDFKEEVSMTKQSHKAECDINNIVRKSKETGMLPSMIGRDPAYGDFSNPVEYQEAIAIVAKAEEQFAGLPAAVRQKFENNPESFLAFASDTRNVEGMVELGLAVPKATEAKGGVSNEVFKDGGARVREKKGDLREPAAKAAGGSKTPPSGSSEE